MHRHDGEYCFEKVTRRSASGNKTEVVFDTSQLETVLDELLRHTVRPVSDSRRDELGRLLRPIRRTLPFRVRRCASVKRFWGPLAWLQRLCEYAGWQATRFRIGAYVPSITNRLNGALLDAYDDLGINPFHLLLHEAAISRLSQKLRP
jgi:hypothetical protein